MKSFATDINNDIYLDSYGEFAVVDGAEAEAQVIKNILRVQQYEYSYDLSRGIDYMGNVLTDSPNLLAWQTQLIDVVKGLSFVNQITKWSYKVEKNNLYFELSVTTDNGEIDIKG